MDAAPLEPEPEVDPVAVELAVEAVPLLPDDVEPFAEVLEVLAPFDAAPLELAEVPLEPPPVTPALAVATPEEVDPAPALLAFEPPHAQSPAATRTATTRVGFHIWSSFGRVPRPGADF